jgi:hypothetical protein
MGFFCFGVRNFSLIDIKEGVLRPVIIPKYREIDKPIIMNNRRTAGLAS